MAVELLRHPTIPPLLHDPLVLRFEDKLQGTVKGTSLIPDQPRAAILDRVTRYPLPGRALGPLGAEGTPRALRAGLTGRILADDRYNRLVAARKEALADLLAERAWHGDETIVDVGAGDGALLQVLLRRRPGLRGIAFDLPQMAPEAAVRINAAGLTSRCQVVAGSLFRDVPVGGDVYVLSEVLRCWGDELAGQILAAVRRAIPTHGSLLLVEEVLGRSNRADGTLTDVLMSIGGAQRTEPQWRALLAGAGFTLQRIPPSHGSVSILEATPALERAATLRPRSRQRAQRPLAAAESPWELGHGGRAPVELRASGAHARGRHPDILLQLTPRELEVARLAARGLTNRLIAARLFLSTATIAYHLRKIYTKLGITSRAALRQLDLEAAWAAHHGRSPDERQAGASVLPAPPRPG